jgi:hypothetical protein
LLSDQIYAQSHEREKEGEISESEREKDIQGSKRMYYPFSCERKILHGKTNPGHFSARGKFSHQCTFHSLSLLH